MSNVAAVEQIYAAFGRGDVPAILGRLSEDVEWEYGSTGHGVPWLEPRRGRSGALAFFQSLSGVHIERFTVNRILDGGRTVVALVDIDFTVKSTGRKVSENDEVHIWHFDDHGRVRKFRHVVDTHAHWEASRA